MIEEVFYIKLLILGAGALGSNLTSNLTADIRGEHLITVLDKDVVEERNVQAGTQFYTMDQVGQPKTIALQYNIYKWFEREIAYRNIELNVDNAWDIEGFNLIIDCFDNAQSRLLVQRFWEEAVPTTEVLHVAFSPHFTFAIEWANGYVVPMLDKNPKFDICEMPGASSFVKMVSAIASSTVQEFIKTKKKIDIIGNKMFFTKISENNRRNLPYIRYIHSDSVGSYYGETTSAPSMLPTAIDSFLRTPRRRRR